MNDSSQPKPGGAASGAPVPNRVVVIGGGLGGTTTCIELRRGGYTGSLVLVDSGQLLHDRPPLSKEYLLGAMDDEAIRLQPDSWFTEHDVEVRLGQNVARAAPQEGYVELEGGERLPADAAVLATGGTARRLPVPGGDLPSVHYLRTVDDAVALKAALTPGARVLVIGAGLIGAEIASAARALQAQVTLVDPQLPLESVVGGKLAEFLHDMHADHGVTVEKTGVASIEAISDNGPLRVHRSAGGEPIHADVVVVGIGMVPATGVAESSGALVEGGVVVNPRQETSVPGLLAVGDCTRPSDGHGTLLPRAEHWEAAMRGAARAAATILDTDAPASQAEWFWTDRHGHHVEVVGHLTASTVEAIDDVAHEDVEYVERGTFGQPPFSVFALAGGTLIGALAVDSSQLVRAARRLIDRHVKVDAAALANPDVDLRKLAKKPKA